MTAQSNGNYEALLTKITESNVEQSSSYQNLPGQYLRESLANQNSNLQLLAPSKRSSQMSRPSSKTSQQAINIGRVEIQAPVNKEDEDSHRPPQH